MDFFQWTFTWILWVFEAFIWVATLMILFMVIVDLFRDHTLRGGWKAVWLIALLLFPLLGALVYIIARGRGMVARWAADRGVVPEQDDWKPAASSSPADDIAKAKQLLDEGTITQGEFDALKSKALGKQFFG
ncbi:SHOCT domain-containing protein [Protaetiibacter mangrovi]|uniref:SHOCT domain-containing protein n=1 Tax=Protaetiibacter mangrovi TaxID=2970926 RepID=A0ABT1ZDT4_9MICO|nr:SHOCT domain-containing protein [Protaetiibacter mangrovi]MCS0498844.1 SHOCT domain-containing protein [Protaetiibacter mangrovi]